MSNIERAQKRIIFEESAKIGITSDRLFSVPEIYQKLVGVSDRDTTRYGLPMAPQYIAEPDELIDVTRISKYFLGVGRDLKTLEVSVTELEVDLKKLNFECWARTQLLKNKANQIFKTADAELRRSSDGGVWTYSEPFTNTGKVDMSATTAWIDTSEGVFTIPSSTESRNIRPQDIVVSAVSLPSKADTLNSTPADAFDGVGSTGWKLLFFSYEKVSCDVNFLSENSLTAVMVDPLGDGMSLEIIATVQGVEQSLVKDLIYKKKTYPIQLKSFDSIKIKFGSASSTLPALAGIRDMVFITSSSSSSATVYTTVLRPTETFSDLKLDLDAQLPAGSKITSYYRNNTTAPWTSLVTGKWNQIVSNITTRVDVDINQASEDPIFRGLTTLSMLAPSASKNNGFLYVGYNQVEVSCFEQDWISTGEYPKLLNPDHFRNLKTKKTWIGLVPFTDRSGEYVAQLYGGYGVKQSSLTRGAGICASRQISTPNDFGVGRSDAPYNEFMVVPLCGDKTKNSMQFGHNYKIKFSVFCEKDVYIGSNGSVAKFWFLQGYRKDGAKNYKEIGKSWGTVGIYINGTFVAGSTQPDTIYSSSPELRDNQSTAGSSFSFRLNKGWNVVELTFAIVDPNSAQVLFNDPLDIGDPYLQFSMTPNFFDATFRNSYGISSIVGSGIFSPVSEFDLVWNLPRDPQFWAWNDSQDKILFNVTSASTVDGFFLGGLPTSLLEYRSAITTPSDIYLRFDMAKDSLSTVPPIFSGYTIGVR